MAEPDIAITPESRAAWRRRGGQVSLPEVHRSIVVPGTASFWRKLVAFYPDFTGGYGLASLYLQIGRTREAIAEFQKDAGSDREMLELMYLGHALGVSGARAEGRKVLEEMLSLSQRRYVSPMYIAVVYEGLGERDRALQSFEKAYAERAINGWILPDPQLDQIRTEPRFKDLMRRMGLPSL